MEKEKLIKFLENFWETQISPYIPKVKKRMEEAYQRDAKNKCGFYGDYKEIIGLSNGFSRAIELIKKYY